MWFKVALLLTVTCTCFTTDVSAHKVGKGSPSKPAPQERRRDFNVDFFRQGEAYPSFRLKQGSGEDRNENKGIFSGFPWWSMGRKSKTAVSFARPQSLSAGTGGAAGQKRYRRDYGYLPGTGFYGSQFGVPGFGYGSAGDFGQDFGYGSDNFRRE